MSAELNETRAITDHFPLPLRDATMHTRFGGCDPLIRYCRLSFRRG
jgi:hypothetical protein